MSEKVNPLVVDLSHWDPAYDYEAVVESGIIGVIYKATEGQSYRDPTYVDQQQAAKAAGLMWGAYHFADGSDVKGQINNFMRYACPDPDELFVLDWEDNPSGAGKMSVEQAKEWISTVEEQLNRPNECVVYGGNTLKEMIHGKDSFFAARRLWLCQYGSTPTLPESWSEYWLWQYTDGVYGPSPHEIDGVGPCDINSYDGTTEELMTEWAPSEAPPETPRQKEEVVVSVTTSKHVSVEVIVNGQSVNAAVTKASRSRTVNEADADRWRQVRRRRAEKEAT